MSIDQLISQARSKANMPGIRGAMSDHEMIDAFNRVQRMVATLILEADEGYFDVEDTTVGFTANTEEADLPQPCAARKITKVTRTDLARPVDLWPIRFQEKNEYESSQYTAGQFYYLRGEKIGFKPTPKSTIATNIKLNYQQLPHALHWAQAKTPTTTTFIMPTSTTATPPYLKAGRISQLADYYVNARFRIISGASIGLERKITAYNPATQTITFAAITAGEVTAITNYDYVILSPLAEEYQDAGMWGMVVDLAIKTKDVAIKEWAESEVNKLLNKINSSVTPRTLDMGRYIRPPADFDL